MNLLNLNMTMDQFKVIYYWEYIHRILGRVLGLVFLLPFIYIYFNKIIISVRSIPIDLISLVFGNDIAFTKNMDRNSYKNQHYFIYIKVN